MSRVCPECGREYFGQTVKCIHCNIPLVEKSDTGAAQQAQGRTSQQTRQTAAQLNYQKVQQARADQERARQQQIEQQQAQQQAKLMAQKQARNKKKQGIPMKTWKLVSGILSIVMFIFVMFQSCAAGAYNALSDNGEISGSAGAMVAIMLLVGGIVSIACRKGGKGGNIAIAILYGIGAFIGAILAGSYTDLKVWSFWCLVCMILAVISASGAGKAGIITAVSLGCVWLIFALFSGNPSGNSARGTGSRSSSGGNAGSSEDTFGLLETAEMNDVQVRMTDYVESKGSEWNEPQEGKVYVLVEFEISNNSDSDISVSSLLSFDAYADGYATDLSLGALIDNENEQLDGSIASGMKMRGWVGYEIPEDWKDLEIHFTENVWSGNKFKFLISN